jgi:hypothetical protein
MGTNVEPSGPRLERADFGGTLKRMRTLDDILRHAKRLKREELSRLIRQLDAHLSSTTNGRGEDGRSSQMHRSARPQSRRSSTAKKRSKTSYAGLLALSGIAGSGSSDVSSNKGKYLAEAYMPRRDG